MERAHDGHDALSRERQGSQGIDMLQYIPAGVVQLDTDYRLVLANATARRHIAALGTAAVGERVPALGGTPIGALLTPRPDGLPHEVVLAGPPSRVFAIWTHPLPATEAGGWVLLIQDATAERHLQRQQAQQERLAAMEQLVAGIANEFSDLLGSILGYTELLQMQATPSQAFQDDLGAIARWGHRGIRMARHMLDLSGQSPTRMRPRDMLLILRKLLPLLERTLPTSIRMVVDNVPGTYLIHTDAALILQLLLNLTLNARDAMPEGGELRFRLSHLTLYPDDPRPCPDMRHGEWVRLTVSDTGRGMSPDVQKRIFDPFFTTQPGVQTGLGLTHVHGIMQQHDGYITAESLLGHGTVFTLYFPSRARAADAILGATPEEVPQGGGETLVVVDSDYSNREALRLTLRYLGYHVLTAANGREAVAMCDARGDAIALVLTALVPTARGGLALVSTLRQRHPKIKVIALLEASHWTARHDLLAQGATTCLRQPPSLPLLAQAVSQALVVYHGGKVC
jgi:two-component system cell cycle sensor histidine kinase/response regulator CckA